MNPLDLNDGQRSRRNLGLGQPGLSPLTGHVDNLRHCDLSAPARYLQTPSETVSIRHPGYAAGRDSLTSSVGPSGSARVEGSHFADLINHTDAHKSATWNTLKHKLCLYKNACIKQANAAHHEKIISAYTEKKTPPSGIFTPIMNTVSQIIKAPFNNSPSFQNKITEITRTYSLQIAETMRHSWRDRQTSLRKDVRSMKDNLYNIDLPCDNDEKRAFFKLLKTTENDIGRIKRKLAIKREWKINGQKKRKLETKDEPTAKRNLINTMYTYPLVSTNHQGETTTQGFITASSLLTDSINALQTHTNVRKRSTLSHETASHRTTELCTSTRTSGEYLKTECSDMEPPISWSTPTNDTYSDYTKLRNGPHLDLTPSPTSYLSDSWPQEEHGDSWQNDIESIHFSNSSDSDDHSEHNYTYDAQPYIETHLELQSELQETPLDICNINKSSLQGSISENITPCIKPTPDHIQETHIGENISVESNIMTQQNMYKTTTDKLDTKTSTFKNIRHSNTCMDNLMIEHNSLHRKPHNSGSDVMPETHMDTGSNPSERPNNIKCYNDMGIKNVHIGPNSQNDHLHGKHQLNTQLRNVPLTSTNVEDMTSKEDVTQSYYTPDSIDGHQAGKHMPTNNGSNIPYFSDSQVASIIRKVLDANSESS